MEKKKFFKYTEKDLEEAQQAVRQGMKGTEAERTYNVVHSTLLNKMKGKVPQERKMGTCTVLTKEEEELKILKCKWIKASAKKGIPLKKEALLSSVADFFHRTSWL